MAYDWRNIWGPDRDPKMSYGEKLGIWLALFLAFSLGVAAGASIW